MEERRLPPHLRRTQQQQPINREPEQPIQQPPVQQRQANAYQQPQQDNHQQQYNAQQQQHAGQQQYQQQQPHQPQQIFPQQQVEQQRKPSKIDVRGIYPVLIRFSTAPAPLYHPPSVHQFYQTFDEGNCGPRYMRSSVYAIGNEPSILQQTEIPFGIVVQPLMEPSLFESELPQVEFTSEPLRCQRCKAYVSPYFQFGQGGNIYVCNICKMKNQVPPDYYCVLGQGNQRGDKFQRDELNKGCYEIIAPTSYIKKEIKNTLILFCIELTQISVAKGLYSQVISSLQSILDTIPYPDKTDVAFITFDSKIFNFITFLKPQLENLKQQQLVKLMKLMCHFHQRSYSLNIENDRDKIDYMLEKLSKFGETITQQANQLVSVGTVLSNAVQLMQPRSGRILYFGCSAPRYGIGKLPQKPTDTKLFGTDQENQDKHVSGITSQLTYLQRTMKILNQLLSLQFQIQLGAAFIFTLITTNKLMEQNYIMHLYRNLTRSYAYDLIMTVRTSPGIILFDYYTGGGKISVRDLELSTLNSDQSIAIMLKQEEKILDPEAYIQYALLIHQLIRTENCQQKQWKQCMAQHFQNWRCRLHCYLTKQEESTKHHGSTDQANQTNSIRVSCQYLTCLSKILLEQQSFRIADFTRSHQDLTSLFMNSIKAIDNRIFEIHLVLTQSMHFLNNFFYPKLFPIHDINNQLVADKYYVGTMTDEEKTALPHNIATTIDKIKSDGIYLLDTSQFIYIYVGQNADQQLLQNLFGVNSFAELNSIELFTKVETDYSTKVQDIIESLQQIRGGTYVPVRVVRQNSPQASLVQSKLVEDEQQLERSYADYLCELHGAIQDKGGV
ncbi:unnamed protein product (macronuclear) [Paramecium tetraurelia]|uniref:Sec23/Sec24 trunk domain-containing protein n=1 Tax=Paramecium tetraurelia TaxID=5888 RepID=A0CRZ5_PARTE|nr:uncharacterized protein GSPATT00038912001 [Paramecium tetraurelia]CAK73562.1 unnamed protein product [Paramecium tetraurelia]|eukprot:XP_001440959.1 hypothetical protein (macronuclear) [Paramecium tetraurelia strain d4-2]